MATVVIVDLAGRAKLTGIDAKQSGIVGIVVGILAPACV